MIRRAAIGDVDDLVELIHDLAEYERSPASVEIDRDLLAAALFAESPAVFAHVAEDRGRIVGMAIWFLNFSTWTGHHGIYRSLGAEPMDEWTGYRLSGPELAALAGGEPDT